MQTEDNSEDLEYNDGLLTGRQLHDFGIGTIQLGIEGMDWSGSYIAGIWDGRLEVDDPEIIAGEQERESAFYDELIKDTEQYNEERRMAELMALENLEENELIRDR